MTQKELGLAVGFDENSADVRIAQYESGARTPKEKIIAKIANVLKVNPKAIERTEIDDYMGLAHTLFVLEDIYGLKINSVNNELCLMFDKPKGSISPALLDVFRTWCQEAEKFKNGEITEDEYITWKYNFSM